VAAQAVAAIDLAPVVTPADIFVAARWKNPRASLSSLSGLSGASAQLLESSVNLLADQTLSHVFHGGVDGHAIAETLSLDAPVDLLVSLDSGHRGQPHPLYAFSVGLISFERAKGAIEAAGPADELAPGLYRIGTKSSGELTCVIGAAAGTAPARLVCGQHDRDVVALAPYMMRNLPTDPPPPTDLHAEVRFRPVEARYGAELRLFLNFLPDFAKSQAIGEPRFDRALESSATGLAAELEALTYDLDRLSLDIDLAQSSGAVMTTSLELRGARSWLANTLLDVGARQGLPPALYWRAPKDSEVASFGLAPDPARYDDIVRALRGLLVGKLANEKIGSEADRKAVANLIALPFAKGTNVVVASGHQGTATPGLTSGIGDSPEARIGNQLGWSLLGVDEAPEVLAKLVKDWLSVYRRSALVAGVRDALKLDGKVLPRARLVPAPTILGKGALDLELQFAAESPDAAHKEKDADNKYGVLFHVLLMPDGKATWLAFGVNRDNLVKHLEMAKSAAPASGTLAARADLEPMRSGRAASSGFITLAAVSYPLAESLANSAPALPSAKPAQALLTLLRNLPHQGDTPVFLTSSIAAGAGPKAELTLNMPKGFFEDLGSVIVSGAKVALDAGVLPKGIKP
jgi:hypothetical protein